VIKTLEAQVGQFLLGCKHSVSRFLPGRAKDLSAHPVCSYLVLKMEKSVSEAIYLNIYRDSQHKKILLNSVALKA
jgi:hypothetical protein